MKKLTAWLLLVCMVLGVCASAEETAQAILASAFENKVMALLAGVEADQALTFSLSPEGEEEFSASFRFVGDNGQAAELSLNIPGEENPVVVQTDGQALWLSFQGQVYTLRFADIVGLLQSAASAFGMPMTDPETLEETVQLLIRETILPGVTVDASIEGTVRVQVDLTARDVLDGLARFGDQAMENEAYLSLVSSVLKTVAGQSDPDTDFTAEFKNHWPEMRKQLLTLESDAHLQIDAVVKSEQLPGLYARSIEADASFAMDGQTAALHISAADSSRGTEAQISLTAEEGESTLDLLRLTLDYNKKTGNLSAGLILPQSFQEYRVIGTALDGVLQCSLTTYQYGVAGLTADVNAAVNDEELSLYAVISQGFNVRTFRSAPNTELSLYWSAEQKNISFTSNNETLRLDIQTDRQGAFRAVLTGSYNVREVMRAALEGEITPLGMKAALTYSEDGSPVFDADLEIQETRNEITLSATFAPADTPESDRGYLHFRADRSGAFSGDFSMAQGRYAASLDGMIGEDSLRVKCSARQMATQVFSFEAAAVRQEEATVINGRVSSGMLSGAFQILWSPLSKSAVLYRREGRSSFQLQQDETGKITLIRVENGNTTRGWTVTVDADGIAYADPYQQVNIAGRFVSETEHVLTVDYTSLRMMRRDVKQGAQRIELRTAITEEKENRAWRIQSRLTDPTGQPVFTAALFAAPGGEFTLLSEKEATVIDEGFVQQLIQLLMPQPVQAAEPAASEE